MHKNTFTINCVNTKYSDCTAQSYLTPFRLDTWKSGLFVATQGNISLNSSNRQPLKFKDLNTQKSCTLMSVYCTQHSMITNLDSLYRFIPKGEHC